MNEYILHIDNCTSVKVIAENGKINDGEEFLAYCTKTGKLFLSYAPSGDFIMGKKIVSKEIVHFK